MREVIGGEDPPTPKMPTMEGPKVTMEGIETKYDLWLILIGAVVGITLYLVA